MPIFAFGKYKGQDFSAADDEYIDWLIDTRMKELKLYQDEKDRRAQAELASLGMTERLVKEGYRALAGKLHPDHGGSAKEFMELKASFDQLSEVLKSVKGGK